MCHRYAKVARWYHVLLSKVLSRTEFFGEDGKGEVLPRWGSEVIPPGMLVCLYQSTSFYQCLLADKSFLYVIISVYNQERLQGSFPPPLPHTVN